MNGVINTEGYNTMSAGLERWQNMSAEKMPGAAVKKTDDDVTSKDKAAQLKEDIRSGKVECSACASRRYVDQSDDPSVSFKTPQRISPGSSKAAVLSHEREHVVNENARAERENRKVVSSIVTLQYAKCPECGASYVSGGLTSTITRGNEKKQEPQETSGVLLNVKA